MSTPDPKRVAFLRSVEIERAAPHIQQIEDVLRRAGAEARLYYTDGECAPGDFPGTAERVARDLAPAAVADRIRLWQPDAFVGISMRDENALRDAVVAADLAEDGVSVVMHNPATTGILANKAETKALLRRHGIAVPKDVPVDGDVIARRTVAVPAYIDHVAGRAADIGYPLLAKPLWESFSTGIHYLANADELRAYLHTVTSNMLLEQCLRGELCSVEIVGFDGSYGLRPLIWKGHTGGPPSFLFGGVRHAGRRPEAERDFMEVGTGLLKLCAELLVNGSVEVEMIYRDGRYYVIEINPRISGTTLLSGVSSGHNTYKELLEMALGIWPEHRDTSVGASRWAFEFPVTSLADDALCVARAAIDVTRVGVLRVGGEEYGGNMVASCEFGGEATFIESLRGLAAGHDLIGSRVLADIEEALQPSLKV